MDFDEVAGALMERLRREALLEPEGGRLRALARALARYPAVPARPPLPAHEASPESSLVLPVHFRKDGVDLRLFTTIATIGTPIDVTAQELRIESYFPMDDATDAWLGASGSA